ncbi:hypothetical protein AKJ16_DCAP17185 [Drosera capensis]
MDPNKQQQLQVSPARNQNPSYLQTPELAAASHLSLSLYSKAKFLGYTHSSWGYKIAMILSPAGDDLACPFKTKFIMRYSIKYMLVQQLNFSENFETLLELVSGWSLCWAELMEDPSSLG